MAKNNFKLNKPDYHGGSTINVLSSIARACGKKHQYKPSKYIDHKKLGMKKNILIMIVDGVGYSFLKKYGKKTFLNQNCVGKVDTVVPPTTGCAMTAFYTGMAPQQHGLTGWYMYMKELGVIGVPLPFTPRYGGWPFSAFGIDPKEILPKSDFYKNNRRQNFLIQDDNITNSDFTLYVNGHMNRVAYKHDSLIEFFKAVKFVLDFNNKKKLILSYWPKYDSLAHHHGPEHKLAKSHLIEFDKKFEKFVKKLKDTTLIVTADHGFMETPRNKNILLKDHPKLYDCLSMPLSGESRLPYCYVHPSKAKEFEKYVKTKLKKYCVLKKSEEILKKNYFGLYKANPKLKDRIGDYMLFMKDGYVLVDSLANKKPHYLKGNHGGISLKEIEVPLIIIDK